MIAYCEQRDIPVKASVEKPYSSDENCLHISYEAGELEDLEINGVNTVDFGMMVSPQAAPDKVENVTIGFSSGIPVSVNGKDCSALEIVTTLNEIGGRNGVGRIDMVENRFVGMKSRGVYESPGMTVLYKALLVLEQLTMDRDLVPLARSTCSGSGRNGLLRILVHAQNGCPYGVHQVGSSTRYGRSYVGSLQRQHGCRESKESQ